MYENFGNNFLSSLFFSVIIKQPEATFSKYRGLIKFRGDLQLRYTFEFF
jgi:hypothetical protein